MSNVYRALKKAEREGRWKAEKSAAESGDEARGAAPAPAGPAAEAGGAAAAQASPNPAAGRLVEAAPQDAPDSAQALAGQAREQGWAAVERDAVQPEARQAPRVAAASAHRATGSLHGFWRMLTQADIRPGDDAPSLITGQVPASRAAERFQLLRVWFENWTSTHNKRVIMVSSALPGEGKSFVSLNLAVTLATAGYRVMLVDADLRRPCLHRPFNLVPLHGLVDYLEGRAEFAECLSRVPALPTLTVVAAGGVTTASAELMAGRRMGEFVEQARALEPPHYVLFDAPAALATPETEILASVVDAALLVVAANHTPRQMVKQTFELLKKTTICGVVLNRCEPAYSTSRKVAYGYYGQAANQPTSGLY